MVLSFPVSISEYQQLIPTVWHRLDDMARHYVGFRPPANVLADQLMRGIRCGRHIHRGYSGEKNRFVGPMGAKLRFATLGPLKAAKPLHQRFCHAWRGHVTGELSQQVQVLRVWKLA